MKKTLTEYLSPLDFSYLLLMLCVFSNGMGQSMTFAVLQPLGRELGLKEIQVGMIITCAATVFTIATPMWGRISDKKGRKPVILIGQAGYALGVLLFAGTFWIGFKGMITGLFLYALLIVSRMAQALVMSATPPAVSAYMADITDRNHRTVGMAQLGASRNIGTILGPAIGGFLAAYHLLSPLLLAAAVSFAILIPAWFTLKEPIRVVTKAKPTTPKTLLDKRYQRFIGIGILLFISFSIVNQTIGFHIQDRFNLSGKETAKWIGVGMGIGGGSALLAQGIVVQIWRWPATRLIKAGLPLTLGCFLILTVSRDLVWILGSLALLGAGIGLTMPGIAAAVSLAVGPEDQGLAAGAVNMCTSAGFIIGPIIGTGLYQLNPTSPYILNIALMIPIFVLSFPLKSAGPDR